NTTGPANTATGAGSLLENTTGGSNTATGAGALENNSIGSFNTATGNEALLNNGLGAIQPNNNNPMYNTATGYSALRDNTGSNNIDIGNGGVAGESAKIRIGKQGTQNGTFIAGVSGVAVTGSPVVVNSSGKLGVGTSSARFKEAIRPMEKASEAILSLKPVT